MPRAATSFWTHNRFDPVTGCWNWTGALNSAGYGQKQYLGKVQLVHRLSAHFYLKFDLHSKALVCHHCDNPSCFNPKHLFIGNNSLNILDCVAKGRKNSYQARLTHCPKGHPYSGDNLGIIKSTGFRKCKICSRARKEAWRQKNKAHCATSLRAWYARKKKSDD